MGRATQAALIAAPFLLVGLLGGCLGGNDPFPYSGLRGPVTGLVQESAGLSAEPGSEPQAFEFLPNALRAKDWGGLERSAYAISLPDSKTEIVLDAETGEPLGLRSNGRQGLPAADLRFGLLTHIPLLPFSLSPDERGASAVVSFLGHNLSLQWHSATEFSANLGIAESVGWTFEFRLDAKTGFPLHVTSRIVSSSEAAVLWSATITRAGDETIPMPTEHHSPSAFQSTLGLASGTFGVAPPAERTGFLPATPSESFAFAANCQAGLVGCSPEVAEFLRSHPDAVMISGALDSDTVSAVGDPLAWRWTWSLEVGDENQAITFQVAWLGDRPTEVIGGTTGLPSMPFSRTGLAMVRLDEVFRLCSEFGKPPGGAYEDRLPAASENLRVDGRPLLGLVIGSCGANGGAAVAVDLLHDRLLFAPS